METQCKVFPAAYSFIDQLSVVFELCLRTISLRLRQTDSFEGFCNSQALQLNSRTGKREILARFGKVVVFCVQLLQRRQISRFNLLGDVHQLFRSIDQHREPIWSWL